MARGLFLLNGWALGVLPEFVLSLEAATIVPESLNIYREMENLQVRR